jgi:hypothetical protein
MKKLASLLALAAVAVSAHAQVTFSGGGDVLDIAGFGPDGPLASLVAPDGKDNALIATTAGFLTATFLGHEAVDVNTFTFGSAGMLSTSDPLNSTKSAVVSAGSLPFTFADLATSTSVGNGGNAGSSFTSYIVLGSLFGGVFTPFTLDGLYDVIISFNDGLRVDGDYDDMVIGLKVVPVPEPEKYALMLAGVVILGYLSRRRRKSLDR